MFPGVEFGLVPATPARDDLRNIASRGRNGARRAQSSGSGSQSERPNNKPLIPLSEHLIRMEGRGLRAVPAEVLCKSALRSLLLSRNLLSTLPTEIAQLRALRRLELCDNHLTGLPVEVAQLQQLDTLLLQNNCLKSLPLEVGFMVQLKTLNLDANPLSGRASPAAEETFLEVWVSGRAAPGECASSPASNAAAASAESESAARTSTGGSLADRTRSMLQYLQDHMSAAQVVILQERRARWQERRAKQQLKAACPVADLERVQRAVKVAEDAGLGAEDTAAARKSMQALERMRAARESRSSEELMAAIVEWEQASGLGEGARHTGAHGPDLEAALEVLKQLKREALAMAWRRRSDALVAAGSEQRLAPSSDDAPASKPLVNIVALHTTPRLPTPVAKTRRERRASSPGSADRVIPFDQWLERKKEAERRKEEEMREFGRQLRMEKMSRKQREEHERAVLAKKEASWPSAIEAGEYALGVAEESEVEEHEQRQNEKAALGSQSAKRAVTPSGEPAVLSPILEDDTLAPRVPSQTLRRPRSRLAIGTR